MLNFDVVIPIYNEEENLPELHRRLSEVCEDFDDSSWRVLYVNDGSDDDSLNIMHTQCEQDSRFSVIDLSHNFGHQPAIAAGLAYAEGDAVIIMDGDLQDPPEVIPDLLACWQGGAQVVRAQRRSRQERGFRRLGFELFHKFFNWISDFLLPGQTGIFGLLDRQAVLDLIGSVIGFIMFRLRPEKEGGNRASSNFLWIMPAVVFFILWIIGMMKA